MSKTSKGPEKKKKDVTQAQYTLFCCHGDDCTKRGAPEVFKALRAGVREAGLKNDVHLIKTHCTDQCKHGPIVIVCSGQQEGVCGAVWYSKVRPRDAEEIVCRHLECGQAVTSKRYRPRPEDDPETAN